MNWLERAREADGRINEDSKWARCDADTTAGLDRFGDIFVWKNNRVKLDVPEGMNDYINAANGFLADRFLYASSYPFVSASGYAEWFRKLPIKRELLDGLMYRNAARFLGLS